MEKKDIQKLTKFSKDNPIIKATGKQSQISGKNVTPPIKPKEIKK